MSDTQHPDFVEIQSTDRHGYIVIGLCVALGLAIVVLLAMVVARPVDRWLSKRDAPSGVTAARKPSIPVARDVRAFRAAPAERSPARGGQAVVAIGDEASWITSDDYPVESIRAEEQGRVTIRWVIGVDGRASDCGVVETSGYPLLDGAACAAITRSALYSRARTAKGDVVPSTKTRRVKWVLPIEP